MKYFLFLILTLTVAFQASAIECGDKVEATSYKTWPYVRIKVVKAYSKGRYYMTDGSVYETSDVSPLTNELGEFKVGNRVEYTNKDDKASLHTIRYISYSEIVHMKNGKLALIKNLSPLYKSKGGISVGDNVEVKDNGTWKIKKVAAISKDRFHMTDGAYYHHMYVNRLMCEKNCK